MDCEWGDWKKGECSAECGGGVRINTRTVMKKAEHGGMECFGFSNVTEICNTKSCPGNRLLYTRILLSLSIIGKIFR